MRNSTRWLGELNPYKFFFVSYIGLTRGLTCINNNCSPIKRVDLIPYVKVIKQLRQDLKSNRALINQMFPCTTDSNILINYISWNNDDVKLYIYKDIDHDEKI